MGWERRLKEPFRERSQKHSKPGDVQLIIFDLTHVGLITIDNSQMERYSFNTQSYFVIEQLIN